MTEKKKRKQWNSILIALLLIICVAASTMLVLQRMGDFLPSDEGAISLNGDDSSSTEDGQNNENNNGTADGNGANGQGGEGVGEGTTTQSVPGMETGDGSVTWNKNTKINIFLASYENEDGEISVQSANGDKVIAPGTGNSYTFKLKNTGNVPLDYKVEMDSLISKTDIDVPLEARISRYDGAYIVGSDTSYVAVEDVSVIDNGTVGPGKYVYYTLEWIWPFEGVDDADIYDTLLGDLVIESNFTFSMALKTEAVISTNPNADGGIRAPKLGDSSMTVVWITLLVVSLLSIFFIIVLRRKDEEDEKVEAKAVETK